MAMTADEFVRFCENTFVGLPAHIRKDINEHVDANSVRLEFIVSDERIDREERDRGVKYSSVITSFSYSNQKISIMFRKYLLNAPAAVARAIITHELVHLLVGPVLHPTAEHKPVSKMHRVHVEKIKAGMEETIEYMQAQSAGTDYEECLVSYTLATWGIDESAALNWIRENSTA